MGPSRSLREDDVPPSSSSGPATSQLCCTKRTVALCVKSVARLNVDVDQRQRVVLALSAASVHLECRCSRVGERCREITSPSARCQPVLYTRVTFRAGTRPPPSPGRPRTRTSARVQRRSCSRPPPLQRTCIIVEFGARSQVLPSVLHSRAPPRPSAADSLCRLPVARHHHMGTRRFAVLADLDVRALTTARPVHPAEPMPI